MRASRCGVSPSYTGGFSLGTGAGRAGASAGALSGGGGVGSCPKATPSVAAIKPGPTQSLPPLPRNPSLASRKRTLKVVSEP